MIINAYGYAVFRGAAGVPLHIVEIRAELLAEFAVFDNARDARTFIENNCDILGIVYNPGFKFSQGLLEKYRSAARTELCKRPDDGQLFIRWYVQRAWHDVFVPRDIAGKVTDVCRQLSDGDTGFRWEASEYFGDVIVSVYASDAELNEIMEV